VNTPPTDRLTHTSPAATTPATQAAAASAHSAALTAEQLAVVDHQYGHAKVVAVAGAGKTTTLTHFIAARLQQGAQPRRMLVLMYNKAAQLDFEAKLQRLLPSQRLPEVRTFHSLGLRIYQRLIEQGVLPPFQQKLLSDAEAENIVWRLLQQLADDDTRQEILSQKKKWVEPAMAFIDRVKAGLMPPADVFDSLDLPPACRLFIELFDQFEQWRKQQGRISFNDMIYDPVMCFYRQPDIAHAFGGHMQWILVDEYQDINEIQQYFLEVLYGGRGSVMVIGDPDQTIYEFRGSKPEFIETEFDRRFAQPHVSQYQLPHTFRYGHEISLLANHLISHNRDASDSKTPDTKTTDTKTTDTKTTVTKSINTAASHTVASHKAEEPVLCLSADSTPDSRCQLHTLNSKAIDGEAQAVVNLIQQEADQHPLEHIAVINRLWALCAPVELGLLQKKIPYQLHNSQSVLDRWELQVFWILLEIAADKFCQRSPESRQQAWLLLLTTPYPKIKRSVLDGMARQLASAEADYGEALVAAIPDDVSKWQRQQLEDRAAVIANAEHINTSAYRILQDYIDQTELYQGIEDSAFSAQQIEDRLQTIKAFVAFIRSSQQSSRHAHDYLLELKQQRLQQGNNQGVHLTSIHKSKGLEWPVVIIPGLNAHYYPFNPEGEFTTAASEESERRLLYVAMTRTQLRLHLLAPSQSVAARKPGTGNDKTQQRLSRFQRELNIADSQSVAEALRQSAASCTLQGKKAPWLDGYLSKTGSSTQLCEKEPPASQKTRTMAQNPSDFIIDRKYPEPDNKKRVIHQTLGSGYVLSQDERYLKVRFDGEQKLRTFDREKAADFLRYDD